MWHSSWTQEDQDNIERVQKNALRPILKGSYTRYENDLELLNLQTLDERRYIWCINIPKNDGNTHMHVNYLKIKTKYIL